MPRDRVLVVVFVIVAFVLILLGVTRDAWWTIVGGVGAAAAAAWIATEPRSGARPPP